MNARLLFVVTTISVVSGIASMAGCTISTNDGAADASPPNTSSSSGTVGDAGADGSLDGGNTSADGGGDAGECLANKQRGPLCEKDETPEEPARCALECDVASTAFSTDIALAISTCIDNAIEDTIGTATPTADQCEAAAGPCVAAATALACENDVEEYCKGILTTCPDKGDDNVITKADCTQYMRGATTQGKQLLLTCLEDNKTDPKVCKICMDALKTVHNGD